MLRDRQSLWRRLNLLGDLLLTYFTLLCTIFYFEPSITGHTAGLLFLLTLSIWTVFLYGPAGSYFYRLKSQLYIIKELFWALGKSFLAFTAVIFFLHVPFSAQMVLVFFVADTLILSLFRLALMAALNIYRARGGSVRNVIILGTGQKAQEAADRIIENRNWGIHVLGFLDYHRTGLWRYRDLPLLGHPDQLIDLIPHHQVDYIIIAVESNDLDLTAHAFAVSEEVGITVCLISDFYNHQIAKAYSTNFLEFPSVIYSSVPDDRFQLTIKKVIDWLGGLIGVAISFPVGLIAAIAIKIEDGGPIFFKQTRAGRNGKLFTMYKFRTMVPNAEQLKQQLLDKNEMSGPVFKMKNDPRITKTGTFLRKASIDELPQLLNVLRGDMSLVGPRPPLPKEVARFDRWQRRKLSVKPGLTCLWQINGRNDIDFEEWMKLDLEYIDNWSLWLDTKILLKTVPAILKGDGAS